LITRPPLKRSRFGSFASNGAMGTVFARSTNALVSDLNEAAV
jgi:hypothetical protein